MIRLRRLESVNRVLRRTGFEVRPVQSIAQAVINSITGDLARAQIDTALLLNSKSQLGQDVFALVATDFQTGGYFVEVGAGDGTYLSNTRLLEKDFSWSGILAEPNPMYHEGLHIARTAAIDMRCVWNVSAQTVRLKQAGYFTSMEDFILNDGHARRRLRSPGGYFRAETVSLLDLLKEHNAPQRIDFLSVDTEGSEFQILEAFPWGEHYDIRTIAVEHNFGTGRTRISQFLQKLGYVQVGADVSKHDSWFMRL